MSLLNRPLNMTVLLAAFAGFVVGVLVSGSYQPTIFSMYAPEQGPLPHQLSKYEGGISLRYAMVHDVIHERFPMHGRVYYEHRNAVVREELKRLESQGTTTQPLDKYWDLMDDLAVGHVHLGEYGRAVEIMRQKLRQQEEARVPKSGLYTTYANFGTAMMIGALHDLLSGKGGTESLQESLPWVRDAIKVNPEAHFGREEWQVELGQFLLDASMNPDVLLRRDMIGNDLEEEIRSLDGRSGMMMPARFTHQVKRLLEAREIDPDQRQSVRGYITRVGYKPAPFDEPTLAIIGMWRYGAGANAHFSLALGETMLRVGQRYIAWSAFERASRLAESFWPNQHIQQRFIEHCRKRQELIESSLGASQRAALRPAFEKDLAAGQEFQRAYQQYEAEQIKAGRSIDDPNFYASFFANRPPIASDPGQTDYITFISGGPFNLSLAIPLGFLTSGIFAFIAADIVRRGRVAAELAKV